MKFIRVNGRVIPVKDKKGESKGKTILKSSAKGAAVGVGSLAAASAYLSKTKQTTKQFASVMKDVDSGFPIITKLNNPKVTVKHGFNTGLFKKLVKPKTLALAAGAGAAFGAAYGIVKSSMKKKK